MPAPAARAKPTAAIHKTEWHKLNGPTVELIPDKEYRAHIKLRGLEASFGDESAIAAKLQQTAGPLEDLRVTKDGRRPHRYEAIGVYAGNRRTVKMPDQVTTVWVR